MTLRRLGGKLDFSSVCCQPVDPWVLTQRPDRVPAKSPLWRVREMSTKADRTQIRVDLMPASEGVGLPQARRRPGLGAQAHASRASSPAAAQVHATSGFVSPVRSCATVPPCNFRIAEACDSGGAFNA